MTPIVLIIRAAADDLGATIVAMAAKKAGCGTFELYRAPVAATDYQFISNQISSTDLVIFSTNRVAIELQSLQHFVFGFCFAAGKRMIQIGTERLPFGVVDHYSSWGEIESIIVNEIKKYNGRTATERHKRFLPKYPEKTK